MLQTLKQSSAQKRENGSGAMHGRKRAANFFPPRSSAKYFERNASKSRDWMNDVREKKISYLQMHDSQIGEGRGDDVGKRDQLGSQDMGDLVE